MFALLCIVGLPAISAEYQICGTNPYANALALPPAIHCSVSSNEPLIRTNVTLYADRSNHLQIPAHKCFRDLIKVRVYNFLYIRTTHHVIGRERLSISTTDCHEAIKNKVIHGHALTETRPGLFSTQEIEEQNISLPLLGSSIYTRSTYSFVTDVIAVIDEETMASSLGNLDNCTMPDGSCRVDDAVIVWQPSSELPSCPTQEVETFEALVTLRHVLIPEYELAFEFEPNFFKTYRLLQLCNISQGYRTTSNHILAFPNISNTMMLQDFIIHQAHNRLRRAAKTLTLADNRTSEYDLVTQQPRLAPQLFESDEIPSFDTQPISDIRILHAIRKWNVSQNIFNRSRLYESEDQQTTALRSIRYAEYRIRQLEYFKSLTSTRPLTYAELTIQRDLDTGLSDIFDAYLNMEFGKLPMRSPTDITDRPTPPYFLPSSLPNTTSIWTPTIQESTYAAENHISGNDSTLEKES
ncbi:unnamed protein product [Nippostrongylus brasiliensis]|uniref:Uncharacterized protein n=1 Tax=Nippostrongylus brasiliensis TaxID=27835 RepID=A0A3P7B3W1_NIPBR|nr:unnamed protein product [Nippostrongylus brasiliensis]